MMSTTTRWTTAIALLLGLMAIGCGADLSKLPPIVISAPAPPAPKPEAPSPKPRATLAFQVLNTCDGSAVVETIITIKDGPAKQVDADGYAPFELDHGRYDVTFEAANYHGSTRSFILSENRQWSIKLDPVKGCPSPELPKPEPPKVDPAPPTPPCSELECVRQAAATYGHLLVTNTYASCVEFTQRVLERLGPEWGHVGKPNGRHAVPRGFAPVDVNGLRIIGVSHDAIKHRSGQVVDILGNATANEPCPEDVRAAGKCWAPGPASIGWELIPAHDWRPDNPFVPAVPVR